MTQPKSTPKAPKGPKTVIFRTSSEVHEKLKHHAKRLGLDMNDIVREGTLYRLSELDAQEDRDQERKGPVIAGHRWGKAPGLTPRPLATPPAPGGAPLAPAPLGGAFPIRPLSDFVGPLQSSTPPTNADKAVASVPENIRKSFRRFAEMIEQSQPDEREARVQTVIEEIKDRTASEKEADACVLALREFLAARAAARPGVPK